VSGVAVTTPLNTLINWSIPEYQRKDYE